jgi:hypothetical protein
MKVAMDSGDRQEKPALMGNTIEEIVAGKLDLIGQGLQSSRLYSSPRQEL